MNLKSKKAIAARILNAGLDRVWFDPNKNNEIKEAITREDLKKLIYEGVILLKHKKGNSRGRFRAKLLQKRKGRMSGPGSKKGPLTARLGKKRVWINRIRAQRDLFNELIEGENISRDTYKHLRTRAKGGFFRSKRHIMLYLTEHALWVGKKK